MTTPYDLFILGSGSTAFAAAIKANELGARVGMVERRRARRTLTQFPAGRRAPWSGRQL